MTRREPKIHPTARIGKEVKIGDWSVVGAYTTIEGEVEIGRAAWISSDVIIGGGQKELGSLCTGDFLHMGIRSFINIADEVTIGDEVGLGMETKIFTHGGYCTELYGFPFDRGPVHIGNNVWLPNAIVLPHVEIRGFAVVAAGSLVNKNIPYGCLAGGVPAMILKVDEYPKAPDFRKFLKAIKEDAHFYNVEVDLGADYWSYTTSLRVGDTTFYLQENEIEGPVTKDTERVRDLLRRRGIRFRYYDKGGEYAPWD